MYTAYFGLDHKPFKSKDPRHFYRNANFDAVCVSILDAIRERCGFILLTGEPGVGKSYALRRCMAETEAIRFVVLANSNLAFPEILKYLCASLELTVDEASGIAQQETLLLDKIATQARENQTITLVIDDADSVQTDTLLQLITFIEKTVLPTERLQIVLVGFPEMEGRLRQPELQAVQERIRVRCRLERLKPVETSAFIIQQLEAAGYRGDALLPVEAIARIDHYCKGIPQSIAILCDALLLLASLELGHGITSELVDEAAQGCFFGEQKRLNASVVSTNDQRQAANFEHEMDTGWDLASMDLDQELDFSQELALSSQEPFVADLDEPPSVSSKLSSITDTVSLPDAVPLATLPLSPALQEFAQLMDDVLIEQRGDDHRDVAMLRHFQLRHLQLLRGDDPVYLADLAQRIEHLSAAQQPVYVELTIAVQKTQVPVGVLCALVVNPSWWQYRELHLQVQCPDLVFEGDGHFRALRLLDGRRARPVYVHYRCPNANFLPTTVRLRLELCNHRGEWNAYNGWAEIRLNFKDLEDSQTAVASGESDLRMDHFRAVSLTEPTANAAGVWLLSGSQAENMEAVQVDSLAYTLPLELEVDPEYVDPLAAARAAGQVALSRGSQLTRALLLADDSSYAPARIELVSRPFMVFGRYNAETHKGFGDFALGFTEDYTRISRLHCVICALGDQLALMPTSDLGHTYTGCNNERLERGSWRILENDDLLSICGLYDLKLTLCWDRKWQSEAPNWDIREPRDKFGRYLLDLVDVLRQVDRHKEMGELRVAFQDRYLKLTSMQERVAELSGVGNPGALLYARFEREDEARQKIAHYYLPKWLPLGSDDAAGLRITAAGVVPRHAELFYRDGMYWIQNLVEPGAVRIGCHGLATNEVLALEIGDELVIGEALFTFQQY